MVDLRARIGAVQASRAHSGGSGMDSYTSTSILNSQPFILNPQSSILNPQSSILNTQSSILNPQSSILNPQSSILTECLISERERVGHLVCPDRPRRGGVVDTVERGGAEALRSHIKSLIGTTGAARLG
jgi:hypothetical protein